ncbi:MAG: ornithine cyclodeaminase family protein [Rickettsiales bacterium]|nr:ornithine cyclodeaminase family protein [Rickettsiales bacterium]|tara:strand:- start:328 stop:1275 length:948 start_codon:yes stop_codon:yes gene_type:complete
MPIKYITEEEILNSITMKESLKVVEKAFVEYSLGKSKMPSKVYLDLPEFNGDFRAMPAYESSQQFAGVKWVNVHANNPKIGLPTVMGTILLNNPETAEPLAVVEGTRLTALRTGAASGVATKYLSSPTSKTLALVGSGIQSFYQAEATLLIRDIKTIKLFDIRKESMLDLSAKIEASYNVDIIMSNSIEDCVNNADIVITTTPSKRPILRKEWLKNNVHINAMGADAKGKRECDDQIILSSQLVIDDFEQASHSGEINVPLSNKLITKKDIKSTLGEIIMGKTIINPEKLTLFDSTGLAIQDIALAGFVYKKMTR